MKNKIALAAFLLIALLGSFPFWKNLVMGKNLSRIEPVISAAAGKECVESESFMRSKHMTLLYQWRDEVVRKGERVYTNSEGKTFNKSLVKTCLKCHDNKEEFCDTCHNEATVRLKCFECHYQQKPETSFQEKGNPHAIQNP